MTSSSADGEKTMVHLLMRGRVLGHGGEGSVCFGLLKYGSSEIPVAVKSAKSEEHWIPLRRESQFLKHLGESEHIVRFLGESDKGAYELFLEYAPEGSLRHLLNRRGPLPERDARRFTRSMLQGLVHIHRGQVVHCDIKPDNLLLVRTEDSKEKEPAVRLKIADFGSAMWSGEENVDHWYRGTAYYLAPESAKKNEYGAPADVWALGCTVAEMVMGKPARHYATTQCWASEVEDLIHLIAIGGAMPEIPERMSEMGKDFLRRCFDIDPRKRWNAEMLLQHPFAASSTTSDHVVGDDHMEEEAAAIATVICAWKDKVPEIARLAAAQSRSAERGRTFCRTVGPPNRNDRQERLVSTTLDIVRRDDVGVFDMWNERVFDIYGQERILDIITNNAAAADVHLLPSNPFDT